MDVTDIKYHEEIFDLIIDKSTMDAIRSEDSIRKMLGECCRILKPGGFYVLISIYDDRDEYFENKKEVFQLQKYSIHEWNVYVAKKLQIHKENDHVII